VFVGHSSDDLDANGEGAPIPLPNPESDKPRGGEL
jgi:hypothetical protein